MSWVKLDDQFFVNRKSVAVGLEGRAMFVASVCYCAMQLNDGLFVKVSLPVIAAMAGVDVVVAERLFAVALWHDRGLSIEVHDYLKYNPSRAQVVATQDRAKKAADARWNAPGNADSNAPPGDSAMPIPSPSPESSPLSSSSDTQGPLEPDDEKLIEQALALYVDRKLASANGKVRDPVPWRRTTLSNARKELAPMARNWLVGYDVSATQLADALVAGGVPSSWGYSRRAS